MRPCVDVVISSAGPPTKDADERAAHLDRRTGDTVVVVHRRHRDDAAHAGRAPWIVLLDAEVDAPQDLVDRLFARTPRTSTAILAGAVGDRTTVGRGRAARAQSENCAVRRDAFEAAGGDGDLSLRLRALGWSLERREEARVERRAPATSTIPQAATGRHAPLRALVAVLVLATLTLLARRRAWSGAWRGG